MLPPDTIVSLKKIWSIMLVIQRIQDGKPGLKIHPPKGFKIAKEGAAWMEFAIDSLPLTSELLSGFA